MALTRVFYITISQILMQFLEHVRGLVVYSVHVFMYKNLNRDFQYLIPRQSTILSRFRFPQICKRAWHFTLFSAIILRSELVHRTQLWSYLTWPNVLMLCQVGPLVYVPLLSSQASLQSICFDLLERLEARRECKSGL